MTLPKDEWHAPGIGEVHNEDHSLMIYCMRSIEDDEASQVVDQALAIRVRRAMNAESRLAAADALLQRTQMKDYDAAEWLRLGRDIATHLQSSDAKREAKG